MKRSEVDEEDKFYTGKASDVVRQLSLLGFAMIWIFKRETPAGPAVPLELRISAILFAAALLFDFLQYVVGATGWVWYNKKLYRLNTSRDAIVTPPDRLYYPAYIAFYAKVALVVLAFVALLYQLSLKSSLFAPPP